MSYGGVAQCFEWCAMDTDHKGKCKDSDGNDLHARNVIAMREGKEDSVAEETKAAVESFSGIVRKFETGATRSSDAGRPDYEGFLSPLVIERFGEHMNKHRYQADGTVRASDNWQKGMTLESYMKGGWRHFQHWWQRHRGYVVRDPLAGANVEEDLCALLFNVQGYLHEVLKRKITVVDVYEEPRQMKPSQPQEG